MNSMVAKAVQLVTRYPTLSHLPIFSGRRVRLQYSERPQVSA